MKREGAKYPGNVGRHPGTMMRALVERAGRQLPCEETSRIAWLLRESIVLLERRAARVHGRKLLASDEEVVLGLGRCGVCGHVGCTGHVS